MILADFKCISKFIYESPNAFISNDEPFPVVRKENLLTGRNKPKFQKPELIQNPGRPALAHPEQANHVRK